MTYYKLVHDYCGETVIYFTEHPAGKVLNHEEAVYPNGIRPKHGHEVRCPYCHKLARCVEELLYEVTDPIEVKHVERMLAIE